MPYDFIPLACIATSDVGTDSCSKARPSEVLCNEGLDPGHTIVSSQGRVMILLHDFKNERSRSRGDKEKSLAVE